MTRRMNDRGHRAKHWKHIRQKINSIMQANVTPNEGRQRTINCIDFTLCSQHTDGDHTCLSEREQ